MTSKGIPTGAMKKDRGGVKTALSIRRSGWESHKTGEKGQPKINMLSKKWAQALPKHIVETSSEEKLRKPDCAPADRGGGGTNHLIRVRETKRILKPDGEGPLGGRWGVGGRKKRRFVEIGERGGTRKQNPGGRRNVRRRDRQNGSHQYPGHRSRGREGGSTPRRSSSTRIRGKGKAKRNFPKKAKDRKGCLRGTGEATKEEGNNSNMQYDVKPQKEAALNGDPDRRGIPDLGVRGKKDRPTQKESKQTILQKRQRGEKSRASLVRGWGNRKERPQRS